MEPPFWTSSFLFPLLFCLGGSVCLIGLSGASSLSLSVCMVESSLDSFFILDHISFGFFFVVGVVSTSVLVYTEDYMKDSVMKVKFTLTMVVFISSMFLLSMSADLFWVMVGWDGLGLSSLVLIMYFQNWKSFNSAMVTFLSNRLGDGLLLLSLIWFLSFGSGKWVVESSHTFFSLFLLFGAFSKSAQVPFSAWLPLAMAAPTPVSSLVHSSTLVTAGVYLLIRFKKFIIGWERVIFYVACVTILLAASSSMGEYDLKKIIALSTLSHIGLMMMFIGLSSYLSVLVHLHSHAMFKSLLFMIAGDLIHKKANTQDVRTLSMSSVDFPTGVSLIVSLVSMMGVPFFAGFYSKELLLSFSSSENLVEIVMFLTAASMTAAYSFRIFFSLISNPCTSMSHISKSPNWKIFSIMSILSLSSGGVFYMMISGEGVEVAPIFPPLFTLKKGIFLFLVVGVVIGLLFSSIQGNGGKFIKWTHLMWWVNSVCYLLQSKLFSLSWVTFFKFDSKGLVDFILLENKSLKKSISFNFLTIITSFPLLSVSMSVISVNCLLILI